MLKLRSKYSEGCARARIVRDRIGIGASLRRACVKKSWILRPWGLVALSYS
jgi:hypothetical protein